MYRRAHTGCWLPAQKRTVTTDPPSNVLTRHCVIYMRLWDLRARTKTTWRSRVRRRTIDSCAPYAMKTALRVRTTRPRGCSGRLRTRNVLWRYESEEKSNASLAGAIRDEPSTSSSSAAVCRAISRRL